MWKSRVFVLVLHAINIILSEEKMVCVRYYQCTKGSNPTVITDGGTMIIPRFATYNECENKCKNEKGFRCCELNDEDGTTTTTAKYENYTQQQGCGIRNTNGVASIKSGADYSANFGEFPWLVGIIDVDNVYLCGGSLIHPHVVLTAAHCVTKNTLYFVRAGEWDFSTPNETLKHQERKVDSLTIHRKYRPGVYYNDVALLFLEQPFDLKPHINVVCLPPSTMYLGNERCLVAGWGKDEFGNFQTLPKKIELPLVEKRTCQQNLRQTPELGSNFRLHNSFICAGGEKDKDACVGDGGGPLICPFRGEHNRYYQAGIVSWGIGCNKEDVPAVYTNVVKVRQWIDEQMQRKQFDTKGYQL